MNFLVIILLLISPILVFAQDVTKIDDDHIAVKETTNRSIDDINDSIKESKGVIAAEHGNIESYNKEKQRWDELYDGLVNQSMDSINVEQKSIDEEQKYIEDAAQAGVARAIDIINQTNNSI